MSDIESSPNIISEVAMTVDSESFLKKWNHSILENELWPFSGVILLLLFRAALFKGELSPSGYGDTLDIYREPEAADLLIVGGTISHKIAPFISEIYDRMPEEKWVLAVGACAASGGPYWTHSVVQGLSQIVPVDVYLPGCPPSKEMIINSFETVRERVENKVSSLSQTRWSLNV